MEHKTKSPQVYSNQIKPEVVQAKVPDLTSEFEYSLWTDLSGEQTEFNEALEYISSYQVLKINVFNLFDFSTLAQGQIQSQKVQFAKQIVLDMLEK